MAELSCRRALARIVRFIGSFNEFGVHTDQESFKNKLLKSKHAFMDVYESAKVQLDSSIS